MTEIRKLDRKEPRVETGPVQFGDDWPGVFIRGDDAAGYYAGIIKTLTRQSDEDWVDGLGLLRGLAKLLREGLSLD